MADGGAQKVFEASRTQMAALVSEATIPQQILAIRSRQNAQDDCSIPNDHQHIARVVSVGFKMVLVHHIDPIQSTFACRFRVYLEWLDDAVVGEAEGKASDEVAKKISVPELSITNAIELTLVDKSSAPWVVRGDTGHVAYSILYKATVQVPYNMSLFPFDSQWLSISITMNARADSDRTFCYQFCDIQELRGLDEWKAHSSFAECDLLNGHARVTFGLLIQRLSRYYILNLFLMLFICSSLTFTVYAIDRARYAERAKIFMVLSLTLVTIKLTVEGKLPKVAYLTLFDRYSLSCQFLLVSIAVGSTGTAYLMRQDMSSVAGIFEVVTSSLLGLTWFLWNAHFSFRAWQVKMVQPKAVKALPAGLNTRHAHSMALHGSLGITSSSECLSLSSSLQSRKTNE